MLGYTEHSEAYQIQTGEFARLNRSNLIWSVYPVDISFRIHLHDFLFDLVGSCLSLFDDFRLEIAISVAWDSDFALAIIADYRLFPVTNSACCHMLCGIHAALWGQLRKHPVCDCFRSYSRLQSSSRNREVCPFLPRASALSSRQTAFSALPECRLWLRPTSWSGSLPSAASPVQALTRLIRVFFSCAHTSLPVGIIDIYTVRYSASENSP